VTARDRPPDGLLDTPAGTARVHVEAPAAGGCARGLVVLGHGAGGGVTAPDLVAVAVALATAGWTVARVEQPYRVRGSRMPDRTPVLDEAWTTVVRRLRMDYSGALVVGGRSSGARVACRTARATGAAAVLCLAFPLQPPPRPRSGRVPPSRAGELDTGGVPVLVVQGERDAFGAPADFPAGPDVVAVLGDHALRRTGPVVEAVLAWLDRQRVA
jgi:predicted alpha/beta-hydrolase family hydrolase